MATGLSNAGGFSANAGSLILGARGLAGGAGLSAGGGLGGGSGGLRLDFTTGTLPSSMTFTRASTAWGFNSAGVLTSYATNAPRFVSDPLTLQNLGLLVEGARTNSARNNTMAGAVAGTPGTQPNFHGWQSSGNGMTRQIVGVGQEDGIDYIEVRWSGTPVATLTQTFTLSISADTAAADTQIWTGSFYLRLIGTNTATTFGTNMTGRNVGGSFVNGANAVPVPTTAPLRTQRTIMTTTLAGATITGIDLDLRFVHTIGVPADCTVRIGLPQLELGYHASSPIKTSTATVTRAIDMANITDARALSDAAIIVKARTCIANPPSGGNQHLFMRDVGGDATSMKSYRDSVPTLIWRCDNAGNQASLGFAGVGPNTDFAIAGRFAQNDVAASVNGSIVQTDVTANIPVPTLFRVGYGTAGGIEWNSTILSLETRATATDAELQTLSFTPLALGASLIAWWDAERADTITHASGVVSAWRDLVGGYSMAQGVVSARPTYSATAFNGRPGIVFDGTNDVLTLTGFPATFPVAANPCWMWGVASQDHVPADGATGGLLQYGSGGATTNSRRLASSPLSGVERASCAAGTGASLPTSVQVTTDYSGRHLLLGKVSGTTVEAVVDGVGLAPTAAVPAMAAGGTAAIGGAFNGGNFWLGSINCVIMTLPLTAPQEAQLQAYLMARL